MANVTAVAKKIIANVETRDHWKTSGDRPRRWSRSFAKGHILLEDVPGVAKTMLARALAQSVGCEFKRIQCTPDLLPTDVTGASIFNPKTTEFEFRAGPALRAHRAGGRNQPHDAPHAVGPAGGDGGTARHRRRRDVRARSAVPGDRHAEPHRSRRDVPAARSAARPLPDAVQPGLSQPRGRGEDARDAAARASDRQPRAGRLRRRSRRLPAGGPRGARRRQGPRLHDADRPREPRARRRGPRRQSPGVDRSLPGIAGHGGNPRARLRAARRRETGRRRRARAPRDPSPRKPAAQGHRGPGRERNS